jgi:hypothetical protein
VALLRECASQAKSGSHAEERMRALLEFFETTTGWYAQVRQWPTAVVAKMLKLGDKSRKLLGL